MSRVKRSFPELPDVSPVAGTKILVVDSNNDTFGYADVADLQVTLDGDGLASETELSAVSSSISSKFFAKFFANTITGSLANDAAAAAVGVPVGGLYHTSGAVKVRLS